MKNILLNAILIFTFGAVTATGWGQAPVVTPGGYDPVNGATDVAVDKVLRLTFDIPIRPRQQTVVSASNISVYRGTTLIGDYYASSNGFFLHTYDDVNESDVYTLTSDVSLENSNYTLAINLPSDFDAGVSYYVKIGNRAIYGTGGTSSAYAFAGIDNSTTFWQFTTISSTPFAYTSPYPNITTITGNSAYINSAINKAGFTYYVALPASNPAPSITQVKAGTDASDVSVPIIRSGTIVLSNADVAKSAALSSLVENTAYKVYCVSTDGNGNNLETTTPTTVSFTTLDQTAPTLTFDPINGATNVLLNKVITATFSEAVRNLDDSAIDNSNIASLVDLSVDGNSVASTVTWNSSTNTITITPTSALIEGKTYYITINQVEDLSNNASSLTTSLFYTNDTTPPVLSSTSPTNGAANITIYPTIVLIYNEAIRKVDGTALTNADLLTLVTPSPTFSFTGTIDATKKIITLTATSDLSPNTLYTINIGNVEDLKGNAQTSGSSMTFTTATYNVWNGNVNRDWSNSNNYASYTAGARVIIPKTTNSPQVISGSFSIPEVIIQAGGGLEIASGATLIVTDKLKVLSSNTASIGNGSILNEGTLSVASSNVTFHQKTTDNSNTYHIASPVVGATQSNIGCDGNIFEKQVSPNYKWAVISNTTPLTAAKGYAAWGSTNSEWIFSGAINNDASYQVVGVRNASNYGWNLAGNPYPCAIDWDLVERTNINPTIYTWLDDQHTYGTYNAVGGNNAGLNSADPSLIPSMHAFFMQVPTGLTSGSINIPASARKLNQGSYMKSSQISHPVIHIATQIDNYVDDASISFISEATEGIDEYDSEKLFNTSSRRVLDIFTVVDSKKLAITGFSALSESGKEVVIGYDAPAQGTYQISLKDYSNIPDNMDILLIDSNKGITQDMKAHATYSFTVTGAGANTERFKLRLSPQQSTSIETSNIQTSSRIPVYQIGREIYIDLKEFTTGRYDYSLLDINGRIISKDLLEAGVKNKLAAPAIGVYVVKITSNEWSWSQKVLIKQ